MLYISTLLFLSWLVFSLCYLDVINKTLKDMTSKVKRHTSLLPDRSPLEFQECPAVVDDYCFLQGQECQGHTQSCTKGNVPITSLF